MQTGSRLVRVVPGPAGGWDVRERGGLRTLSHATKKDAAVRQAGAAMLNGGIVQVLDAEGSVLETHSVPGPGGRPWWYVPPRPLSWVIGLLFLVQGAFGVAGRSVGELRFWLGLMMLLLACFSLVLLVVSRRHDRRLQPDSAGSDA